MAKIYGEFLLRWLVTATKHIKIDNDAVIVNDKDGHRFVNFATKHTRYARVVHHQEIEIHSFIFTFIPRV